MLRHFTVLILVVGSPWCAAAKDWPTYRGDAARSGWTDESLPAGLALRWSYHPRHPPQPAWPREDRMHFDRAFHVAVAGGLVFFGSSADGKVYALDAAGGTERWSFFTDVRCDWRRRSVAIGVRRQRRRLAILPERGGRSPAE